MTYTIDKIPPPVPFHPRGRGAKGPLRLALEAMEPGDGLLVADKTSSMMGAYIGPAQRITGYKYTARHHGAGCYVWCLPAATEDDQ